MDKIVVDTSIVINGKIVEMIKSGGFEGTTIIIPEAVVDELQSMATQKKEEGIIGLEEIRRMQEMTVDLDIHLEFAGTRPSSDDVGLAERGRIDAIIKDVARQAGATLYTSDRIQSMVAHAQGVDVRLQQPAPKEERMEFLRFFDQSTMSVHLKEGMPAMAKRGRPGHFDLVPVGEGALTREYLRGITAQILEASKSELGIEISKPGALVIQYADYRIAVTQAPFSERYEITIVHPTTRLSLEEYDISDKLMRRLTEQAEGILISGPPGSGKSTLASGLANFYQKAGKVVKTFESPRDLQVDRAVTQYTRLDGSFENSADILMLVRPDYTIFDEIRRREDFAIFSDLRLAGVGMVGVAHASAPLDAIQRFIGKIELGVIPSVLDTVLFVKDGMISKVYRLELKVKVPSGMVEQDLARPVIEIRDFDDDGLEYEIYTFGEENVVIPVTSGDEMHKLVREKIVETFKRFDPGAQIEVLSGGSVRVRVERRCIPSIIGRGGSKIAELERQLQVRIDVQERDRDQERDPEMSSSLLPVRMSDTKRTIYLHVGREYGDMLVDILDGDRLILTEPVSRKGQIKIHRHSREAREIENAGPQNLRARLRSF